MRKFLIGAAFAATMAGLGAANASTNLLVNGSFETGDFTGWTLSGNVEDLAVLPSGDGGYPSEDGNYYVNFGPVGSDGDLSQTFTDTPGQPLLLSGWVAGNGTSPSDVNFIFNGVTVFTLNPVPDQGYVYYSVEVTGTGTDTFTVGLRNDPSFDAADNFAVTTTTIPEPSTWAMMLIGFAGLGFAGYRASRRAANAV